MVYKNAPVKKNFFDQCEYFCTESIKKEPNTLTATTYQLIVIAPGCCAVVSVSDPFFNTASRMFYGRTHNLDQGG